MSVVCPTAFASSAPALYHTTQGFTSTRNFTNAGLYWWARNLYTGDQQPQAPYHLYTLASGSGSFSGSSYAPNYGSFGSGSPLNLFYMNVSGSVVGTTQTTAGIEYPAVPTDSIFGIDFKSSTVSVPDPYVSIKSPTVPSGYTRAAVFIAPLVFRGSSTNGYGGYTFRSNFVPFPLVNTSNLRYSYQPLFGVPYIPTVHVKIFSILDSTTPLASFDVSSSQPISFAFDATTVPAVFVNYYFTSHVGLENTVSFPIDSATLWPSDTNPPSSSPLNYINQMTSYSRLEAYFAGPVSSFVPPSVPTTSTSSGTSDSLVTCVLVYTNSDSIPGTSDDPTDPGGSGGGGSFDLEAFFSRLTSWVTTSFSPDAPSFNQSVYNIQTAFQDKFGVFYQACTITYNFFHDLLEAMTSTEDYVFTWDDITMDLFGETYVIIPGMSYNANEGLVPVVRPYLGTLVMILCAFSLIRTLQRYWEILIDDHFFLDFTG